MRKRKEGIMRRELLALVLGGLVAIATMDARAGSVELTPADEVGLSEERLGRLRPLLQQYIDDGLTAGIQILVARDGKVVMHENFGVADVESRQPITDDSLFRVYSMTKPITGVGMMLLYEQGLFSLADPLAKHIPEFAGLEVYTGEDEDGRPIVEPPERPPTMHDLLRHTAGFTYGLFGDTWVDRRYNELDVLDEDSSLQDMIDKLADTPLLYQPGTRWHYSVSVDIQGYLIEKLSGQDLETFFRERIFEPLGMDETTGWLDERESARLVKVHTHNDAGELVVDTGFWASDFYSPPGLFMGGAQLISTTDDYWRFAQMLLNGGSLDGVRLLSPLTVDLMTSNHLPETVPGRLTSPGTGFGIDLGVVTDATLLDVPSSDGEYSWSGAATTIFWVDPAERLVVLLFTQYAPWDAPRYIDLMHRMVRAAIID
jgi:CubicO group peptidase (beta-lactamase class C family)